MLPLDVDKVRYRPEIDGLRAIAVLGVVVYHLRPDWLTGGFVGVDVFFVISGYLICRNILSSIARDRFTLRGFYGGRIRRLYPSYLTVMLASTAAAWFILTPEKMQFYASSLVSSLLYWSNINFWLQAGYFDINSSLKPLLHTWSLSVEEQFYLLFPMTILLTLRWRLGLLRVLAALLVVSFAANCLFLEQHRDAVFYLLPFRGWELLTGALLSLGFYPRAEFTLLHRGCLVVGVILIGSSFALIDHSMAFPGYLALLPVTGTYLLIGSAPHVRASAVLRVLRAAPLVKVGLMSYALYLWHWPVVVFYKIYRDKPALSEWEAVCLFALCLALSWLSTFVIEPPFRRGKARLPHILALSGSLSLIIMCFGVHLLLSGGASYRYPQATLFPQSYVMWNKLSPTEQPQECQTLLGMAIEQEYCQLYGGGDNVDFVIWGDSHARELAKFIAASYNNAFMVISAPGCPPLLGAHRVRGAPHGEYCAPDNLQAIEQRLRILEPGLIVLVSRWSLYHQTGARTGGSERSAYYLCDKPCSHAASSAESLAVFKQSYATTVASLTSFSPLLVFKSVPELSKTGREIVLLPETERALYIPSREQHRLYQADSNAAIDTLQKERQYQSFDPAQSLCRDGLCTIEDGNALFYFDDNHLNALGWKTLANDIAAAFARSDVVLTARQAQP